MLAASGIVCCLHVFKDLGLVHLAIRFLFPSEDIHI